MTINHQRTALAATIFLCFEISLSPSFIPRSASADPVPSNADMKALYEDKCSACHDAYDPAEKGYSAAEWQSTVNRMMTAHDARQNITDPQAAEIVTYLSEFAPKPSAGGTPTEIGVWQTDPTQSESYPFTYGPNLQSFDIKGGIWKVVPAADIASGYLKEFSPDSTPNMIVDNKNIYTGGLDARCKFEVLKSSSTSAVGIVFGLTDKQNYFTAEYFPETGNLTLVKVSGGSPSVIQQQVVPLSQSAGASPWHDIRVKVTSGGTLAEVWLDYQKQFTTTIPQWSGGRVGIVGTGPLTAAYRQLTIDTYLPASESPAEDIMLH